jgi:D-lactate dehydrogenase (cytochrome)
LKNSAGYDLKALFLGSEGTLGIITSVTVKLHPVAEWHATATAVFDDLHSAATAVAALKLYDIPVLRCELLDSSSVQAFNAYSNQTLIVKPTLFLEFQAFSGTVLEEQINAVQSLCSEDYRATAFESSRDADRSAQLWAARHKLYYAAIAARPGAKRAIVTDACVPLSQFPSVLEATAADVAATGVVGPCFGHAGDGNLHCILPVCEEDASTGHLGTLLGVHERLMQRTLKAGGTVSGEHGVGYVSY